GARTRGVSGRPLLPQPGARGRVHARERRGHGPAQRSQAPRILTRPGGAPGAHRQAPRGRGGERLMDHTQVLIGPVVSEESYVLSAADRYTFRVHSDGHKTHIRQAVEELFEVRTMSVKSKPKRRGTTKGRTRTWKKAIVQVRAGETIPIFQGLSALEG